jgi:hypothetical protein
MDEGPRLSFEFLPQFSNSCGAALDEGSRHTIATKACPDEHGRAEHPPVRRRAAAAKVRLRRLFLRSEAGLCRDRRPAS